MPLHLMHKLFARRNFFFNVRFAPLIKLTEDKMTQSSNDELLFFLESAFTPKHSLVTSGLAARITVAHSCPRALLEVPHYRLHGPCGHCGNVGIAHLRGTFNTSSLRVQNACRTTNDSLIIREHIRHRSLIEIRERTTGTQQLSCTEETTRNATDECECRVIDTELIQAAQTLSKEASVKDSNENESEATTSVHIERITTTVAATTTPASTTTTSRHLTERARSIFLMQACPDCSTSLPRQPERRRRHANRCATTVFNNAASGAIPRALCLKNGMKPLGGPGTHSQKAVCSSSPGCRANDDSTIQ